MVKVIPGFGDVKLPVLNNVRPFTFLNQDGKRVTENSISGKVYLVEYFFTTCPNICPMMNNNMKEIYDEFKSEDGFLILSHTCNPDTDSVPVMKHYADSMGVDTQKWWFLTGRKDSLYQAARYSYLIDDPKNSLQNIEDQFMHTQFFSLVDKSGRVRKVYDGLKKRELDELREDIRKLLKEPASDKRFTNNIFAN
jgi:protein SCO1/2